MALPIPRFVKDPNANPLDYTIDWSAWLQSAATTDTISSVSWTVPTGLTKTNATNTTTTATIWLSGGVLGSGKSVYKVTCLVTTAGGRTEAQSFELLIQAK